jgi:hypothetical protein
MMTENSKLHRFFTVEYKGTIYFRFDTYGPEYTVWMKVDKADQVDNVDVYNFLEMVYKNVDLDIIKECRQTGKTRTTTKNLLEKAYYEQMTNEIDISKVLIEGDTATIMGVKYKRVETPQSFYDKLEEWIEKLNFTQSKEHKDLLVIEILNIVKEFIPEPYEGVGLSEYFLGYNDAIRKMEEKLK